MPWVKRVAIGLLVFAVVVVGVHFIGEGLVVSSDVRSVAEKAFSDVLNTRVDVSTVHLNFLNQIVLGGLKIEQHEEESGNFFLADINRIVFRYHILDLFRKKFDDPRDVRLDAPQFEIKSLFFPYDLFVEFMEFVKQGIIPAHLSIRGGTLRFEFSQWNLSVVLTDIKGDIESVGDNSVEIDITAKPPGRKNGKIRLIGQATPLQDNYDINCTIEHVNFKNLAIRDMCGQIWIKDRQAVIQDLSFIFNNMRIKIQGVVRNIVMAPELDLTFEIHERDIQTFISLKGPYEEATIDGSLNFLGFAFTFDGSFKPTAAGFAFDNMLVNNVYEAQAEVDLLRNVLSAHVEKGVQRFDVKLNIQDFNIDANLKVEHVTFMENDIVTASRIHLEPHESFWQNNRLQFRGNLESDFFIYNYEPLDDFSGKFMFSFKEAREIEFKWGRSYRLIGGASLQKPNLVDLKLLIKDLDVSEIKRIGGRIIPDQFVSGTLNGEFRLRGKVNEPQIDGCLIIRDGFIGEVDFDQFIIHCYGNKYYLRLKDSKVRRKGSEFDVNGDIDFRKENIFEGLEITTKDHVIVWKGWDLIRKEGEDSFKLGWAFDDKLSLDFESALKEEEGSMRGLPDGEAGMEYEFAEGKSIRVSAKEDRDKEYLTVGPKIKF